MLSVKNLTKKYGKQIAVNGINIQFNNGIYGLLGPNGAGKTTLLSMIMGALRPDQGEIFFEGVSLAKSRDTFNAKVGYLPQGPVFYKEFTGAEFLEYICVLKDIPKTDHKQQIERVMEEVNLIDVGEKRIGAYSGGMRQRLGIAQALLGNPQVLVFDEPTAGLDPIERIRFRNTLSRFSSDKTIIIATHIVTDIESIAQAVVVIKDGIVLTQDSPESLMRSINGMVWSLNVPIDAIDHYISNFRISNIQLNDQHYALRIIHKEAPDSDAVLATPRLEEVYIYLTKGTIHDDTTL